MDESIRWLLSPGSTLADAVTDTSPYTEELIAAIAIADPPCSSGNPTQDTLCTGFNVATGFATGRVKDTILRHTPVSHLAEEVWAFGKGMVDNHAEWLEAIRIGTRAGIPGYAYGRVTVEGETFDVYVDATQVPKGGNPQVLSGGSGPPVQVRRADRRSLEAQIEKIVGRAVGGISPYLGNEEAFARAHAKALAAADLRPVIGENARTASLDTHPRQNACAQHFLGCDR